MNTAFLRAAVAITALFAGVQAAIRTTTSDGTPLFRTDAKNVQLLVNTSVKAGAVNAGGEVSITADSNVMQALTQAAGEWNAVSTASVHFASLQTTSTPNTLGDSINEITIEDTAENRSVVGDALAVTVYAYESDGGIIDTDVILNPDITENGQQMPFSTNGSPGTFDLQSVIAHEMGHTLGSDHSGLLSATMVPSFPPNDAFVGAPKTPLPAALSTDDIAFVSSAYPASSAAANLGSIHGTVTSGGQAITAGLVVAVSPSTGRSVCTLSAADGSYELPALPVGSYLVYAQPLDGPVQPDNIYSLAGMSVNASFRTAFFGGNASPSPVSVTAGSVSQAPISVAAGSPALTLPLVAIGTQDLSSWSWTGGANTVEAGQSLALLLSGTGIDSTITASDIEILGPGITVQSVAPAGFSINGQPALAVDVVIAPRSSAAQATIVVHKGSEAAAYSGGLILAPGGVASESVPSFTASGIRNAASLQPGPVAPGEIFVLMGSGLGPPSLTQFALNSQKQMPTTLGGTEVRFDGVPVPLIFSMAGEVSGVVPYGASGSTTVVVSFNGSPSNPVTIPVSASAPGLFAATLTSSGPVAKGGTVVVYGTGDGWKEQSPAGTVSGSGPNENGSVTATIGGIPAKVTWAGAASGLIVGLFQANIEVPPNVPAGTQPLVLTVNGAKTQAGVGVQIQ